MSILSGKSNQFQLPFIYLTVWEEPYLHRTSPKMKSLKWKISSHWETEPICCSYRTEDGQKRQEKGKVCWRKPSKILFSNLFSDQFWQNGDQRRVGVCWQRRSSLQGETHQLLGSIDHRWFSCLFLGGIDHWCLSYLFLGFINHRCFSCIFIGPRCPWGPIYGSGCLKLTDWESFCKLNWCDSGWWIYQLNTNW